MVEPRLEIISNTTASISQCLLMRKNEFVIELLVHGQNGQNVAYLAVKDLSLGEEEIGNIKEGA